jgi:hypothetical protein
MVARENLAPPMRRGLNPPNFNELEPPLSGELEIQSAPCETIGKRKVKRIRNFKLILL